MSQPIPASTQKPRIRWVWALIFAVCMTPLALVAVLAGLYMVARQQQQEALVQVQASQIALLQARQFDEAAKLATASSIAATPETPSSPRKQAQVVRIQVDFEDFESRTADAITVESSSQPISGSWLMVPSEVLASITAKINGRMVTRAPSKVRVVDPAPDSIPGLGMSGAGMGGMPGGMAMPPSSGISGRPGVSSQAVRIVSSHPSLGLTKLWWHGTILTPVRVLGDFPKATVGDKLLVVTSAGGSHASSVTVLGTDETVHAASGGRYEHLLKLTEYTGPLGAMVCNQAGAPVGQIAFTIPGKLTYSYAIPMDQIFAVLEQGRAGAIDAESMIGTTEIPKATELSGRDTPLIDGLSDPLPAATLDIGPQKPAEPPALGDTFQPADASQLSVRIPDGERRIYRVQGSIQDAANTVRSLHSEATVVVDERRRAVIVNASPEVLSKIAATIEDLNTQARALRAEQTRQAEIEENQKRTNSRKVQPDELDEVYKIVSGMFHWVDITIDERAGTFLMSKLDPRTPHEVVEWLSHFFGKKADFEIDDSAGTVLITVKEPITRAEVNSKMAEPIATTAPPAVADQSPPTISKPGGTEMRPRDLLNIDQDREVKRLALQFRNVAASDKASVRTKLEQQVERQFRQRQLQRKQEIDDLSYRLEKLRTNQLRREENRTEIIRRRVDELLDPNSDLRWDESQAAKIEPTSVPEKVPVKDTTRDTAPASEPTFDGIPYSQWRKMLIVEKKPEKLMAAMDACARLATVEDAHQVAKELIRATGSELSDSHEHSEVWRAAIGALERMPPDAVIDEIVASLRPSEAASRDRTFQGVFLAEYGRPAALAKALDDRGQQVVAVLIKEIPQKAAGSDWLLAGACRIWEDSKRNLDEFEGLRPLVMQRVDSLPEGDWSLRSYPRFQDSWFVVVNALTRKNPETPDLAVKLMKHSTSIDSNAFAQIVKLVGQLGRRAEPAVPMIVEQFVREWGKIDNEAGDAIPGRRRGELEEQEWSERAPKLIELLGKIGVGEKAASLLKELNLISTMTSGFNANAREVIEAAVNAIDHFDDIPTEDGPPILRDELLIRGVWQVASANSQPLQNWEARIGRDEVFWVVQDNGQHSGDGVPGHYIGSRMGFDSTKSPKEIDFQGEPIRNQIHRRNGIYELTETTLKIYLAPTGKQRPPAMVKNAEDIPEEYSLIELRRSLPDRPPRPKP